LDCALIQAGLFSPFFMFVAFKPSQCRCFQFEV